MRVDRRLIIVASAAVRATRAAHAALQQLEAMDGVHENNTPMGQHLLILRAPSYRFAAAWQQLPPSEQLRRLPIDWQPRSDELLAAARSLAAVVRGFRADAAEAALAAVDAPLAALEAHLAKMNA